MNDRQAVRPLISVLGDKEVSVRRAAAEALGNLKEPSAAKSLAPLLADQDFGVRSAAQNALVTLKAVDTLIEALKHSRPIVRMEGVRGLSRLGDKKAVEALNNLLQVETDEGVKSAARDTLKQLQSGN